MAQINMQKGFVRARYDFNKPMLTAADHTQNSSMHGSHRPSIAR